MDADVAGVPALDVPTPNLRKFGREFPRCPMHFDVVGGQRDIARQAQQTLKRLEILEKGFGAADPRNIGLSNADKFGRREPTGERLVDVTNVTHGASGTSSNHWILVGQGEGEFVRRLKRRERPLFPFVPAHMQQRRAFPKAAVEAADETIHWIANRKNDTFELRHVGEAHGMRVKCDAEARRDRLKGRFDRSPASLAYMKKVDRVRRLPAVPLGGRRRDGTSDF